MDYYRKAALYKEYYGAWIPICSHGRVNMAADADNGKSETCPNPHGKMARNSIYKNG